MKIQQIFRKCKNSLINAIGKLKGSDKRITLAMIDKDIGRNSEIGKWFITIRPEKCIMIPTIQLRV